MRSVVFDLDGTLIDSLPDIANAVNVSLAAKGFSNLAHGVIEGMIGDGAKVLLSRAFAASGAAMTDADLDEFVAYYTAHSADDTRPYPGIVQALTDLQAAGHVLAVCTNKPEAAAREILSQLRLERFFDVVVGGDTTPYRKPDPRHLDAVLVALGTRAAVMVGDHQNDIAAAAGLGVPAIFAAWGYGHAESPYVAETAADLVGLVDRLA